MSGWSARSRAAARTNELDAGKRRKILEGEEGLVAVGFVRGRVRVPGRVAGGVVSQAPIRRRAGVRGGCHDHVSGTGLLSQMIERGAGAGSCRVASAPGAWRPFRLHGRRGVAGSVASMSASRCQARVSSLRAIAMVAIFFPRRFAIVA